MARPGSIGSNFQNILRQAQRMQQKLAKVQEGLAEQEYVGEAAGGQVKATVTGAHQVVRVDVTPGAVEGDELELLLDLVAAAVNDGVRRAKEDAEAKTAEITGGAKIPGLM